VPAFRSGAPDGQTGIVCPQLLQAAATADKASRVQPGIGQARQLCMPPNHWPGFPLLKHICILSAYQKMWALCDLAMYIIDSKFSPFDANTSTFSMPLALPEMYYKQPAVANFQNNEVYIPLDVYTLGAKSTSKAATTTMTTSRAAATSKRPAEPSILDDENPQVSGSL